MKLFGSCSIKALVLGLTQATNTSMYRRPSRLIKITDAPGNSEALALFLPALVEKSEKGRLNTSQ